MTDATPFPIDFNALERGSVVPASVIAEWCGHAPETSAFGLGQMKLAELIKRHFLDVRGDTVSIRSRGRDLVVLTHKEQNQYVPQAQRQAMRTFARRHAEDQGIDASQLTNDEQARRDDRLRKSAWLLQQSRRSASTIPQPNPKRALPEGSAKP